MVNQIESRPSVARGAGSAAADIDQGLRSYMLGVYNYMSSGVLLTGLVALFVGTSQPAQALIFGTPLRYVALFAPLAIVLVMSFGINRLSATATKTLFWVYAATMGLSLGSIFLIYTGSSIARVFFISAATFGALSLYGYTTKKDLSGFGTFLIMGLFGLIIASLVNLFLKSDAMSFIISVVVAIVVAVTSQKNSPLAGQADIVVELPVKEVSTNHKDSGSIQFRSTLFEQACLVYLDGIILSLVKILKSSVNEMHKRHSNLE